MSLKTNQIITNTHYEANQKRVRSFELITVAAHNAEHHWKWFLSSHAKEASFSRQLPDWLAPATWPDFLGQWLRHKKENEDNVEEGDWCGQGHHHVAPIHFLQIIAHGGRSDQWGGKCCRDKPICRAAFLYVGDVGNVGCVCWFLTKKNKNIIPHRRRLKK